jgi:hypothetical protein
MGSINDKPIKVRLLSMICQLEVASSLFVQSISVKEKIVLSG